MSARTSVMPALVLALVSTWSASSADPQAQSPAPPTNSAPSPPAVSMPRLGPKRDRPTQAQTMPTAIAPVIADLPASAPNAPKFVAEDKWLIAGYNNDEIIYQVFITNHDTRIIRCTTVIHGFYFDNGTKQSISDRQITTVFPNQPTQAGTWLDMDQKSGATYSVQCHPI
jgi:hypothetical protein